MKITSIVALLLCSLGGCAAFSGNGAGYLEHPQPRLRETAELETTANPLEIVEKQAAKILKLKMENRALNDKLTLSQVSQTAEETELQKLQQRLTQLEKQHKDTMAQLDSYEKLVGEQEQKLIDLNIAKVKAEQEVIELKIDMLKLDREQADGVE